MQIATTSINIDILHEMLQINTDCLIINQMCNK